MYIVELINNGHATTIHSNKIKLKSGKIIKGISTIDSFTFSMFPNNVGFNLINEFTTLVTVYNTNKGSYDFHGRVLYAETTMDESGLITKTVTCESLMGYLCDSWQLYTAVQHWTISELLQHMLDCHNSQVEVEKRIKLGVVANESDLLFHAVQRQNTLDAIKSILIDNKGGEIRIRVESDGIYLDYLTQIGETKETPIEMSVNMKSITKEQDPTSFVTRLIPLGKKLDEINPNVDERLDISEVNDGVIYIDDEEAIKVYGIHVGCVMWDETDNAIVLLNKGKKWLKENNKVQIKYSITALDLSLKCLAYDDFSIGNTHPIINPLLSINDYARIVKQTIDICEETKSTIEVGDNLKTLSDIQREQTEQLKSSTQSVQETTIQTNATVIELSAKVTVLTRNIKTVQEQVTDIVDSLDNEWIALELDESFVAYEELEENLPMYKVTGNVVEVKGCICPVEELESSTEKVVFTSGIPEEFCPSTVRSFICQGSGMNRWMLTVEMDGTLTISKYGVTECVSVPTTEVLTFNGTYMVEQKESDES